MAPINAPVKHIAAADGVTYAYRFLHPTGRSAASKTPLVMHNHFRSHMSFWDPSLLAPLSAARPVLIFDSAGVGQSTGTIATTYAGWASALLAVVRALGLARIDLLGFSMGGYTAQMVALAAPEVVRRLVLAGTGPSQPAEAWAAELRARGAPVVWPREQPPREPIGALSRASTREEMREAIRLSFFPGGEKGRRDAEAYWARICEAAGGEEGIGFVDAEGTKRQMAAGAHWHAPDKGNSFSRLGELRMPVLVLNGDDDLLIPTSRSWELLRGVEAAKLVIYPRAGHGFMWQYAGEVAREINGFLDAEHDGQANL